MIRLAAPLCAFLALFLAACDLGSPYNTTEALPREYYRMTAAYEVRASGERIAFDYVVVCGGTATNWTFTTPSILRSRHPVLMFLPTSTGEAVGIRTIDACDGRHWNPAETDYPIPDDLLPQTYWFPNVENLGFSMVYSSDLAYESPYAKLKFLGAKIALSNKTEWDAWREKAKAEYEQIGGLPGPWGYDGQFAPSEVKQAVADLNGGQRLPAVICFGTAHLKIPEPANAQAQALVPDDVEGRYWLNPEVSELGSILYANGEKLYNGGRYAEHIRSDGDTGVRRSDGEFIRGTYPSRTWTQGGSLNNVKSRKGQYYHDIFPVLDRQPLNIDPETGATNQFARIILHDEKWNGFQFCGKGAVDLAELHDYASGKAQDLNVDYTFAGRPDALREAGLSDFDEWEYRLLVNDEEIARGGRRQRYGESLSFTILDREGYVFPACCSAGDGAH